jgi:hypothetical protein
MIKAFPRRASVLAGTEVELCVSTDAPAFRVAIYRWGAEITHRLTSDPVEGRQAPAHLPFHDWSRDNVGLEGEDLAAWPSCRIPIGEDWPSGVYVAVLLEGEASEEPDEAPSLDARDGRALFVVRSATPDTAASILYKLPLFTWHAYNLAGEERYDRATGRGGWCLYTLPAADELPASVPPTVSIQRPGGGTGATPFDDFNVDLMDPRTLRQTFAHWDACAVAWLERRGYRLDFCTDFDLHEDGDGHTLAPYRLLLSFGHDEYYSRSMRTAIERFVAAGGNAAFFSGNTAWWEVVFHDAHAYERARHWWQEPVPAHPENALTGVSFRNGGERPLAAGVEAPVGFQVQHADHWVYEGTGLRDGDVFGGARDEYLVGYECDGAHFDRREWRRSRRARASGADATPADFAILGVGDAARAAGERATARRRSASIRRAAPSSRRRRPTGRASSHRACRPSSASRTMSSIHSAESS